LHFGNSLFISLLNFWDVTKATITQKELHLATTHQATVTQKGLHLATTHQV
jgi:hypothetical protein